MQAVYISQSQYIYHTPNKLSISTYACGFLVVTIMVITMVTKRPCNRWYMLCYMLLQELRGGRECQSAISPRQASDSRMFRGAGAPRG